MSSAFRTGLVLCLTGLITILIALFLVPLIANQLCYLQPKVGLPLAEDLTRGGQECSRVFAAGFLAIFSVPGTLLLLIGSFVVVMATTNRIAYSRSGYRIKNDWGKSPVDDNSTYTDK
ncbi:MAG TPA: hypothetical protein VE572_05305 [Nitrososphaeraceae archaeon]|nr:hypothetical protein [Nitrososphaeraceae archaeon]